MVVVRRTILGIEAASLRVGYLGKAPVELHASFFLAALALTYPFWMTLMPADLAFAGICVAVTLASVLMHEGAHAMVARHYGIPVARFDIRGFGGVVQFGSRPIRPRQDFVLTYAGAASNVVLALISGLLLLQLLEPHMVKSGCETIQDGYHPLGPAGNVVAVTMYVNLALALANLLPMRPLDGGKISYRELRRRAGQRGAGVMISLLTVAQAMTGISLLLALLIVGLPG